VVRVVGETMIAVVVGRGTIVLVVCTAGGTLVVDRNRVIVGVDGDKAVVDVVIREEVAVVGVGGGVTDTVAEDGVGTIDVWVVCIWVVGVLAVDDVSTLVSVGENVRVGVAEVVCVRVNIAVEV